MARTKAKAQINAALFDLRAKRGFLVKALGQIVEFKCALVVSDDVAFLSRAPHISFAQAALDRAPVESATVIAKMEAQLKPGTKAIIIDMRWAIANSEGASSIERWGTAADALAARRAVISVYDLDLTIEEQMQAAFRVHRQFLGPSGLHANPHWISPAMLQTSSRSEQLMFLLGRVVPDYQGLVEQRKSGEMLARGATPSWLSPSSSLPVAQATGSRWHIHCFGRLRVVIDGRQVEWQISGSTPRKTRTLFAYLLQSGEKGAHAEQISELLWPDEEEEDTKRARLHHTVAMLRKTLGDTASVLRLGDFYRLNAPQGSWIDIETFEQLCRRGRTSLRKGDIEATMQLYLAADKLYAGDLFEDVPREYAQSELEDWCMPRRVWLREMALKLQNDLTHVLRGSGRSREALEHCLKALALDPADEGANAEAMRIFAEQGREEAVQRQYRQYKQAVSAVGAPESAEIRTLLRELSGARRARA